MLWEWVIVVVCWGEIYQVQDAAAEVPKETVNSGLHQRVAYWSEEQPTGSWRRDAQGWGE